MNRIYKYIHIVTALFALLYLTGCSKWTDTESVTLNEPNIETQDPVLYAQYLTNLRSYKLSDHRIMMGWFDNSNKVPLNRAQHISSLPDSLDYIILMTPDTLTNDERNEMLDVNTQKGTKIIYTIDFDSIKNVYDTRLAAADSVKKAAIPSFNSFLVDSLTTALKNVDKYGYGGVNFAYVGMYKLYMTDSEKETYSGYENDFLGIALDWHSRHTEKELFFQGKPQNLIDQSILSECKYIIISSIDAVSESGMIYDIYSARVAGVPTDKFVPLVQTTAIDSTDVKTGFWVNNVHAVTGAASWVAGEHTGMNVVGLGVYNISNDYYHSLLTYPYVRKAISIMNPSIKQ